MALVELEIDRVHVPQVPAADVFRGPSRAHPDGLPTDQLVTSLEWGDVTLA